MDVQPCAEQPPECPDADTPPECPECDKALQHQDSNQEIGEFLEWINAEGITLCRLDREGHRFYPAGESIEHLLARFRGIDLDKMHQEQARLLRWVQNRSR